MYKPRMKQRMKHRMKHRTQKDVYEIYVSK